jgi:peptide/nickel transport system permease protein
VLPFLIRRLFWALFMFVLATMLTYLIFYVVPRDPAQLIPGINSTTAGVRLRHSLHLDVPVYQQYWIFLWNMLRHGALGYSYADGQSVRWLIRREVPVTASLVLGGAVFWLTLSLPIGIISALRPRSFVDRAGMVFVLCGISAPAVWFGLVLAYVFGYKLHWFPIADYCNFLPAKGVSLCSGPVHWAYHLILPWVTFMFVFAALYARIVRVSVLETLSEDYVRTARAKGASGRRLLVHHVLRTSLVPLVTILGLDLGLSISGALFTEIVFNLPGLGNELVRAAKIGNLPVAVGVTVVVSVAVIALNFLVDLSYAWLDPRIRLNA